MASINYLQSQSDSINVNVADVIEDRPTLTELALVAVTPKYEGVPFEVQVKVRDASSGAILPNKDVSLIVTVNGTTEPEVIKNTGLTGLALFTITPEDPGTYSIVAQFRGASVGI